MPVNRKVSAGGLAGALSIILVWALKAYGHTELPPEVASGVTTLISFATSYFVTEPD
jgi:uncharacterized membrane protein YfcA